MLMPKSHMVHSMISIIEGYRQKGGGDEFRWKFNISP